MNDLITRLSEGEGANRELDGDIALHLAQVPPGYKRDKHEPDCFHDDGLYFVAPLYCTSLDTCIALAEKVLPGCFIKITMCSNSRYKQATVDNHIGTHNDFCRAFLIALITAKETSQ